MRRQGVPWCREAAATRRRHRQPLSAAPILAVRCKGGIGAMPEANAAVLIVTKGNRRGGFPWQPQ